MSYDTYRTIFVGGLILSIVMLIATIAIFFLLKIKTVIGDLTGSNARKGIEDIRNQSYTGKARDKNKKDTKRFESAQAISESLVETSKISLQDRYNAMEASETTMLSGDLSETSVLSNVQPEETPVVAFYQMQGTPVNPNFVIETDITYVHSSEIIK